SREVDFRRARHADRAGAGAVRECAEDPQRAGDAVRYRPRLSDARPARAHAFRRGSAAGEARRRAGPAGYRPHAVHSRRADDRTAAKPQATTAAGGNIQDSNGSDVQPSTLNLQPPFPSPRLPATLKSWTAGLLAPILAAEPRADRDVFRVEEAARKRAGDVDIS